jgi:hypothetical protein
MNSSSSARILLHSLLSSSGHQFWPDELSLMDPFLFPSLPGLRHLTALYILGLAVKHGGRFATFDAGIDPSLIPGGSSAYYLVPA